MGLRRLLIFPVAVSFHLPVRIRFTGALDEGRIEIAVRNNCVLASNTRRAYAGALKQLQMWLRNEGRRLDDAALAGYIEHLHDDGLAASSAQMAVKSVRCYFKLDGLPWPDGPLTAAALKRFRRESSERGCGRADPLLAADAETILATAETPRSYADGRRETTARARRRGLLDAALVAVLFLGGMRRSEAAGLTWNDIVDSADGQGIAIHVRRSKTNPDGNEADVRFVIGRHADAIRQLRRETGGYRHPERPVFGGLTDATLSRRLAQAARHAGIDKRISGHSGRTGLAVELTVRGASTHEIMHAGNWKSPSMVAHYSAAARAERGAVARLMGRGFSQRVGNDSISAQGDRVPCASCAGSFPATAMGTVGQTATLSIERSAFASVR